MAGSGGDHMADAQGLIRFRRAEWTDETAADLGLMRDLTERDLAIFEARVAAGEFFLHAVTFGDHRVGWIIWSTDHQPDGFDLVVNAAAILPVEGADMTEEMYRRFMLMARQLGARAIRCWTTRDGLRRKLTSRGAICRYEMEIVL